jgi:hypothetical protein
VKVELDLWSFTIVAPDHPDGYVEFDFGLFKPISSKLRERDKAVWRALLDQVDDQARRHVEDALS